MKKLIQTILIIIGFILLIKGADILVDGSSSVAKKLHIPEIVIGLTIVSIGTSMPELFVSTTSAIEGCSDISIGNIIGSNICNLLLILGLSAMIKPVKFQQQTKWIENPLRDRDAIMARQNQVTYLIHDAIKRDELKNALAGVYDLTRLSARIAMNRANAIDLVRLAKTLMVLPSIKACIDDPVFSNLNHFECFE